MRKISLVLFAALLFVSGNVLATNPNADEPSKLLSTQIRKMLNRNSFGEAYEGAHAQVRFTLNKEGEIVVLSVDTDNSTLEGFVKGKLNYKKVQLEGITEGKMYTVSVRIAA